MRGIHRRPLWLGVAASVAVIVLGASVVLGANVASNGGPVTIVRTKTATTGDLALDSKFTDMGGMSLTVTVPAHQVAILVITLSMQSACFGSFDRDPCYVRVLVDDWRARPGDNGDVIWDSSTGEGVGIGRARTNSMQFIASDPAGAGVHDIRVQFRTERAGTYFEVGPRTLTVLASQQPQK